MNNVFYEIQKSSKKSQILFRLIFPSSTWQKPKTKKKTKKTKERKRKKEKKKENGEGDSFCFRKESREIKSERLREIEKGLRREIER